MNAIAFYTTKPFWAGEPLDLDKPDTLEKLTDLMSEPIFSYQYEPFTFQVCKDGMLILHMRNLEAEKHAGMAGPKAPYTKGLIGWWGRYLDYANCLNLLLDSSVLEVENAAILELSEITNKDAMRMSSQATQFGSFPSLFFHFHMARYPKSYGFAGPQYDFILRSRFPLPKAVFDLTAERFHLVSTDEKLVRMLSTTAKSLAEYKVGNYRMSIVLSWFVTEANLLRKWEDFLEARNETYNNGSKRISADRKKILKSRDYPISVIINILELAGMLDFALFKDIDTVRDYRNDIVHQDPKYVCEPEHCQLAIKTALKLALEHQEFTITPNLSYSIIGT